MLEKRVKTYLQIYRNRWIDITEEEVVLLLSNTKKLVNLFFNKFIINLNSKIKEHENE